MSVDVVLWQVSWWALPTAVLVGYTAPKVARWLVQYKQPVASVERRAGGPPPGSSAPLDVLTGVGSGRSGEVNSPARDCEGSSGRG